jgi:catechol 2,3-dioxygenase-like lactoylglutathione lyase family enzyme
LTVILDHVGLKVVDFQRSRDFYTAALGALGIKLLAEFEFEGVKSAGYGSDPGPTFWLGSGKTIRGADSHVAFSATSRSAVESFYTVALATGGRDNGPPGLRPHYHPDYYAAYVFDPDGNNIEAVYVGPRGGRP